jgi:hypothetical protein
MLDSDDRESAGAISITFSDKPIPQFWDGERLLGKEVSRSLGVDATHASWDIYLFYPPDAEWTEAGLPPPAKVIVQAMGVVIGAKGTLPPKGDQSRSRVGARPSGCRRRATRAGQAAHIDRGPVRRPIPAAVTSTRRAGDALRWQRREIVDDFLHGKSSRPDRRAERLDPGSGRDGLEPIGRCQSAARPAGKRRKTEGRDGNRATRNSRRSWQDREIVESLELRVACSSPVRSAT